jgi:hypothetical protein
MMTLLPSCKTYVFSVRLVSQCGSDASLDSSSRWRNQLGGGLRKSLKDFEEEDEEDWGDLVAQFSPKPKKGGRTAHAEEEEEWEKSLASRSKSTIVRPTHEHHKRRSAAKADLTRNFLGNDDDEDWGDLTEQLNKKSGGGAKTAKSGNKDKDKRKSKGRKSKHNENAEDDENWDDLAKQLSPRGKNLQKVLQDFAESDEDADDWADLGKQLVGKDAASKDTKAPSSSKDKSSAIRKLGQFAEGDDDDDWGDLASQLSPRRRRTSSADPPRTSLSYAPRLCLLVERTLVTACVVYDA